MFTKLRLKNFKSFRDIEFNLLVNSNKPAPIAVIYGENGSGKSNLISAFSFLKNSLNTISFSGIAGKPIEERKNSNYQLLVAESSVNNYGKPPDNLSLMARKAMMIDTEDNMVLEFQFYLHDKPGVYEMEFDTNNRIVKERLQFLIKDRVGALYEIEQSADGSVTANFSSAFFANSDVRKVFLDGIEQYWGKHTFLAIYTNEALQKNTAYLSKSINNNFIVFHHHISSKMAVWCTGSENMFEFLSRSSEYFWPDGHVNKKDLHRLKAHETALNTFFTRLYSDVKSVHYEYQEKGDVLQYELYFMKMIGDKIRRIPFSEESTGTKKILEIFPLLLECVKGGTILIDEIDTGVHDMLMAFLVEDAVESFKGQFIVTTHNTILMEKLPPEAVFIIDIDSKGDKRIESIRDMYRGSGKKLQKNHNHQTRYESGFYGGAPFLQSVDLQDIADDLSSGEIARQ